MSDQLTLSAEPRERAGKGASRHLRREGRVPAVIYGDRKDPVAIHVAERELARALGTGHFMNSVVMIDGAGGGDGGSGGAIRTLPKDVQFHPVSDRPVHVDFLRIGEHSTVTVAVPLVFENEEASPGLKRGGVLSIIKHDVELVVDAAEIPDQIAVDLKGFEVGDSIHISAVTLPRGARTAIDDRDFTIATITAPSALKSQEGDTEEGAPAAEPETE